MIDWRNLIFGKPRHPAVPNLRESLDDGLYFESLSRGTLISGNPGAGKTSFTAMELVRYAEKNPDLPIILLDYSSSCINEFISIVYSLPPERRDAILKRIVLDIPGHPEWVMPKPFFSPEYGLDDDEIVEKVRQLLIQLNSELIERNPMMKRAITTTAPNIFRLLNAIENEQGESWQITEAKRLLIDHQKGGELQTAVKQFGGKVPNAKWYIEKELLREDITPTGMEARTAALISALDAIESRPIRARYGYSQPAITEQEIIDKGLIYLVSGEMLTNQEAVQEWVFWEAFSSLRAIINRRIPHDPRSKKVLLVIDEVYRLFEIKGMAKALGEISTYFRSRGLMPIIIIQAYWQLSELLKEQIWNLGNHVTFSLDNFNDAYRFAQQMVDYNPTQQKLPARNDGFQPVIEPDRGQYLTMANWIQNLKGRQIVMRRYINEQQKESHIHFVARTREKPQSILTVYQLQEIKEDLFKKRAILVKDAIALINKRKLRPFKQARSTIK